MRYLLQPSSTPGKWVCTDKENGLVCVFEDKKFNKTQAFTLLEDVKPDADKLVKVAKEMGDWLRINHYDKIF